jgi:uracil-DNA glycosylase family 4
VSDRALEYAALVRARQGCRACATLTNPALFAGGRFDCDRLGPYTQWQGNLSAELVVVGQDFAGVDSFERLQGWPGPKVGTNLALIELLAAAGIALAPPELGQPQDAIFLTNAIQCLKPGGMQGRPPVAYARECVPRFLVPVLALIRPRAVVTLGEYALSSLLEAYGLRCDEPLVRLVTAGRTFELPLPDGRAARLFPRLHPSPTVRNAVRSLALQKEDWAAVGAYLGIPPLGRP